MTTEIEMKANGEEPPTYTPPIPPEPINTGGPVAPTLRYSFPYGSGTGYESEAGMTVRDYMATHLAAGWLASYDNGETHPVGDGKDSARLKYFVNAAYDLADAMIERSKR